MTEDENVEILKRAYQLWNDTKASSLDHWMDLIADDVHWRSISDGNPGMEFSRTCQCKNDIARYFAEVSKDWEMIHYSVDEYIAQGDRVVVLGQCAWKHRKTGRSAESPKADIIRMKDGKIVEFFEFFDTAKAYEAAREDNPAPSDSIR